MGPQLQSSKSEHNVYYGAISLVKSQLYTRLWRSNANINNSGSKLDKRSYYYWVVLWLSPRRIKMYIKRKQVFPKWVSCWHCLKYYYFYCCCCCCRRRRRHRRIVRRQSCVLSFLIEVPCRRRQRWRSHAPCLPLSFQAAQLS